MGHFAVGLHRLLGYFQLHGLFAAGLANGQGNAFDRLRRGFGHFGDGGGIALGLVDSGLFFALRAGDEGLAFTRRDVDLFLAAAFRGGNQGALLPLGGDLGLHGVQDFAGWCEVFDLVTQHLHAPIERGLVNGRHHLGVDDVALFKCFVQLEFADHAAQTGLRQLRDRHDVVR